MSQFDDMVDDAIKYYKEHGRKIGDKIPSDTKLAEILGMPVEVFYQTRQMMRPAYQYRHCLDEQWEVVFVPRNGSTPDDKAYQAAKPIQEVDQPIKTSISKLYRDWCEHNIFVPADTLLAYFLNCDVTTLSHARRNSIKTGWKFERITNGWQIVKPEKPKTLEEMSKDELLIMLKKLVEK